MNLTQAIQVTAQEIFARPRGKPRRAPVTLEVCIGHVKHVADGMNIGKPLCPTERQTLATLMRYVNEG